MKKLFATIIIMFIGIMGVNARFMSKENFTQVHAAHILVKSESEAKDLMEKIKKGEDFSDLAKEYSLCPSGKNSGGDLGFFGRGVMVGEFEDAAFKTPAGEISEPFKTDFGWHIIQVMDKI